jgi:hypothetical protein
MESKPCTSLFIYAFIYFFHPLFAELISRSLIVCLSRIDFFILLSSDDKVVFIAFLRLFALCYAKTVPDESIIWYIGAILTLILV